MNKNLYQVFMSSSSASCVQWRCQSFVPKEKLSWKDPLVIVRGLQVLKMIRCPDRDPTGFSSSDSEPDPDWIGIW